MKNKIFSLIVLSIISLIVSGCGSSSNAASQNDESQEKVEDFELYDGEPLIIGVIGEVPNIDEHQITFNILTFKDLLQGDLENLYDAILIDKDNLIEASQNDYSEVYTNSNIPFLFVESSKNHLPFIDSEKDYNDEAFKEMEDNLTYITLYSNRGELEDEYVGYSLYNDEMTETNKKEVYSRAFKTIETLK